MSALEMSEHHLEPMSDFTSAMSALNMSEHHLEPMNDFTS